MSLGKCLVFVGLCTNILAVLLLEIVAPMRLAAAYC